jgi:hypothetical protein
MNKLLTFSTIVIANVAFGQTMANPFSELELPQGFRQESRTGFVRPKVSSNFFDSSFSASISSDALPSSTRGTVSIYIKDNRTFLEKHNDNHERRMFGLTFRGSRGLFSGNAFQGYAEHLERASESKTQRGWKSATLFVVDELCFIRFSLRGPAASKPEQEVERLVLAIHQKVHEKFRIIESNGTRRAVLR